MADWLDKNYYSLNAYFKNIYGQKCYKIAVDAGLTCPNRDGKIDNRGCIFCSAGGSGDFAVSCKKSVEEQIEEGINKFNKSVGEKFVIYFQAYTNTYGDIDYLRDIWTRALEDRNVIGISIATRPDCLDENILNLLKNLRQRFCDDENGNSKKFIWIELGLQTIHEETATYIRRGYKLEVYDEAVSKLNEIDIPFITHIIIGLPYETEKMILETVKYVNKSKPFGVKLQLLHILKNTDLEKEYINKQFNILEMDEYIELVIKCMEYIDKTVVIHRVTGDGPKKILIEPLWSGNKKLVLNSLHRKMKKEGRFQGSKILS